MTSPERSRALAETLEKPAFDGDVAANETIDTSHVEERDSSRPSTDFPVERWSRYEFVRTLGAGGMGVVYLARDCRLGRTVALKFIHGAHPKHVLRLLQEARAQSLIEHECICKVYEVGEVEGKPYIAMQFVDGIPLAETRTDMSLHEKVVVIRDAALALHEAHKLGIVHRDIKPSNILVVRDDGGLVRPVVMDFGLAREQTDEHGLTESGALLGTPAYMSPEQARGGGRSVDRRADVYSLGATLYELVAGVPPFVADTVVNVILKVIHDAPAPPRTIVPSVPEDVETIVMKCLMKEASGRYDSAKLLADDLGRYIAGEPIVGRKVSLAYRVRRIVQKHRALVSVATLAFVAVLVAATLAIRARVLEGRQATELAEQARFGRELGQDVKEMEWFLRSAYELPLHDVRREQDVVRERMADLDRRGEGRGPLVAAQVAYALGTGHLALHEDIEAERRLTAARDGGLDTPELHYALGLALGRRYDHEIAEARRTGDRDFLQRERKHLDDEYLKPTLASLERSRSLRLESPSFLEGLIAHYRHDDDAAIRLAQKAEAEAPWLYEAKQLEADVLLERGVERQERGDLRGAEEDLNTAADLYEQTADLGRSDPLLYEGAAEARVRRMELVFNTGASPEARLPAVIELCRKAMVCGPERAAPYVKLASGHMFVAQYLYFHGGNPMPEIELRVAAAREALRLDPAGSAAIETLSTAYNLKAQYLMDHGGDATADSNAALEYGKLAVKANPGHSWCYDALGCAYSVRGQAEERTGLDPEASWSMSITQFGEAARVDSGYTIAYSNQLDTYGRLAQHRALAGKSPLPLVEAERRAFDACIRSNPTFLLCRENQGIFYRWVADYERLSGGDFEGAAIEAQTNLEASLSLDFAETHQTMAELSLLRAEAAIAKHEDVAPIFAAFDRSIAACLRLDPESAPCTTLDARRAVLLAKDAPRNDAAPLLEKAKALASLAVQRNPKNADAHEIVAEIELRSAESSPRGAGTHVAEGLLAVERGLLLNARHAGLLAAKGRLLLVEARAESDRDKRRATVKRAVDSFKEAFAQNPLLRAGATAAFDEATRLTTSE